MSKRFFWLAFAAGFIAIAWVALGFVGSNWIAFAMTVLIAGTYLLGAAELRRHRADSAALAAALAGDAQPVPNLGEWLARVPPALRGAVRHRIEEGRGGLPGPTLTPYLVGLLVMLGMLGTFLGMVVTFKGAVFALEGSTDLQAIRAALAEPIRGLGLAFGTSVAGVAASALLGLMSAISRRERLEAARLLDHRAATVLRPFSLAHQREETLRAAQAQAAVLPAVVDKLEAMMARMEQRSQQLDERLLASQAQFHRDATAAYSGLAKDVGASLQQSLAAGAKAAGDSIRPVMESAMTRIAEEQARNEAQRLQTWTQQLHGMAAGLDAQWQRSAERADAQSARTLEHISRLLVQSEELVRARADSEARLSQREDAALQERTALVERLGTLVQTVEEASRQAGEMAAHASANAVELSSWGEAFGQSVQLFHAGNEKLVAALQQVEAAVARSTARSDEQVAYYVAQAREVIDLSIASQHGVIERLREFAGKPAGLAAGAKG